LRTYSDSDVRYFLLKSSVELEREVFGKGLPPGRVLIDGWERFVVWRRGLPYLKCLRGLQPREYRGIYITPGSEIHIHGNRFTHG
jgi:hypothetical protein